MIQFERDLQADTADALRIEVEAPRIGPGDAESLPDGSTDDESGAPPTSPQAAPQRPQTPPSRAWHWLLRAVGLMGALSITFGIFGLAAIGKRDPAKAEPGKPGALPPAGSCAPPSSRCVDAKARRRAKASTVEGVVPRAPTRVEAH
jgi:hypothetical protein